MDLAGERDAQTRGMQIWDGRASDKDTRQPPQNMAVPPLSQAARPAYGILSPFSGAAPPLHTKLHTRLTDSERRATNVIGARLDPP